jgi:hypothetical protein
MQGFNFFSLINNYLYSKIFTILKKKFVNKLPIIKDYKIIMKLNL